VKKAQSPELSQLKKAWDLIKKQGYYTDIFLVTLDLSHFERAHCWYKAGMPETKKNYGQKSTKSCPISRKSQRNPNFAENGLQIRT
jgi:hypothetical protein